LGGLHQRGEIETAVTGQQLDLAALDRPELPPLLKQARLRKRLKPVFVTEFDRTLWPLRIGESSVQLSVDRGAINAGTSRERICELELELVEGSVATLFDLASELQGELMLRPMSRSKAERGYALAGVEFAPVKASPIALDPQMSCERAAIAILAAGSAQLQANEHGMLTSADPEYLHQMRVAVRRLRSALAVFKDALPDEPFAALRRELKWLGRRLGVARDRDVLQTELLPPFKRAVGRSSTMESLDGAMEKSRAQANRSARTAVRSRRYAALLLGMGRALSVADWRIAGERGNEDVLPFSARLLEARFDAVVKRGAKLEKQSAKELHALRIAIKKLRYALEFFAALYPGESAKSFRARAVDLQDCLGTINDQAGMQRLIEGAGPWPERFVATLEGWCARVVFEQRERLRGLWRSFRRARRFW
jgi:inorganic triphosphatase YgiF